jgi:hypothetical protein
LGWMNIGVQIQYWNLNGIGFKSHTVGAVEATTQFSWIIARGQWCLKLSK